jgi:methionyl-tRNA formyltransferase
MRILFCGSGGFAVPSLRAILSSDHELVGVITPPARPGGRGAKLRPTPVAQAGRELGVDVKECPDINAREVVAGIRALAPDVMCVADFGQFVRAEARQSPPVGAFNLHGALLPALRGAAPINWAIIRGCQRTGVTTLALADKMDAGELDLQAETDISPDETAVELRQRLSELGAKLVCQTLDLLTSGDAHPREQDESLATKAPRLKKTDGIINWGDDAISIRNRIHGTWEWPGAQTLFQHTDGGEISVVIARGTAEDAPTTGEPGRIDKDLCVGTGAGRLRIVEIKPANKRRMGWRDFVNGYRVREGDRFVTIR